MKKQQKSAEEMHANVPPDWYFVSIRENLLQRFWHKTRFKEVAKLIEKIDGKILDIGCADGMFTKVILQKSQAIQIIGIDVLPRSIAWAKKHWKDKRLVFKVGEAEKLDYPANTFDAVFALEVLEHVHDPFAVLAQIKKVLKKGGYGMFLVPSDSNLFKFIWFFWTKFRGKIWEDTHIQTYRHNYLVSVCKKVGFKIDLEKKFLLGMLQVVKVRKT